MVQTGIDRTKVSQTTLDDADADNLAYWMGRTTSERIGGIEHLRRWIYGDAAIDKGLQRVLTAVELGAD
jgi:hypothetical protein